MTEIIIGIMAVGALVTALIIWADFKRKIKEKGDL